MSHHDTQSAHHSRASHHHINKWCQRNLEFCSRPGLCSNNCLVFSSLWKQGLFDCWDRSIKHRLDYRPGSTTRSVGCRLDAIFSNEQCCAFWNVYSYFESNAWTLFKYNSYFNTNSDCRACLHGYDDTVANNDSAWLPDTICRHYADDFIVYYAPRHSRNC